MVSLLLVTGHTAGCPSAEGCPGDWAHWALGSNTNTTEALSASITLAYFTLTALPGFLLGVSAGRDGGLGSGGREDVKMASG